VHSRLLEVGRERLCEPLAVGLALDLGQDLPCQRPLDPEGLAEQLQEQVAWIAQLRSDVLFS
jgi:hypothetical protein